MAVSAKPDKEELLNQIKAYLGSIEVCSSVFINNPNYLPYCEAQRNASSAHVTNLVRDQVDKLQNTAKQFLTASYSTERTNKVRTKP